eukprot:1150333-Pelagomonas_calceolata.AAC.5
MPCMPSTPYMPHVANMPYMPYAPRIPCTANMPYMPYAPHIPCTASMPYMPHKAPFARPPAIGPAAPPAREYLQQHC